MNNAFRIWKSNKVLLAIAYGLWGDISARDFSVEIKTSVKKMSASDWGHIVYLDNWVLGTPTIEPIIEELSEWCFANGLRYTAQIYSKNMLKAYQLANMIKTPAIGEKRHFLNQDDAFAWMHSKGFACEKPEPLPEQQDTQRQITFN